MSSPRLSTLGARELARSYDDIIHNLYISARNLATLL
jgi:hypothetical protein